VVSQGKVSPLPDIREDPRWLLARRIASSTLFQRSPRLKALLLYVTENSLLNPGAALNEHQIGCAVFERAADYSPGEDNIVRVQARHLRSRLEEYFQNEGRAEPLVLEIPKGGYIPAFRPREEETPVFPERRARLGWPLYAAGLVLAAAAGWFLHGARISSGTEPQSWMLAAIFGQGEPVRLVVPDSSFGLLQGFVARNLTLDDYLKPGYPAEIIDSGEIDKRYRNRAQAVASRPYTTYPDVVIASRAAALAERNGWKLSLAFPRQITPRDIEAGHFVLVGSPKSNPWTGLFERDTTFHSFYDIATARGGIRNPKPTPGEASEYVTEPRHGYSGEAYALVGLHLTKKGNVLTLAGTNMEGTEAAWEFVSSPEKARSLAERAGWSSVPGGEAHLEAVLRTHVLAGFSRDTQIVAVRQRRVKPID